MSVAGLPRSSAARNHRSIAWSTIVVPSPWRRAPPVDGHHRSRLKASFSEWHELLPPPSAAPRDDVEREPGGLLVEPAHTTYRRGDRGCVTVGFPAPASQL